jgi:FtsP/CotA-like multicopper oxidase with cupredoxin domain
MQRREFLELMGTAAGLGIAALHEQSSPQLPKADVTLRIAPVGIEIAPGRTVKTTGYNGSAPGPVLRFPEGKSVTVEVFNDTAIPEFVHWHGLFIPSEVDGTEQEGTPPVPPHGARRYSFVPRPSGTRWYHTHVMAERNLKRSTYTGQFGFLYVEPKEDPGRYDAEVFLALHGWEPFLSAAGTDEGMLEVGYEKFSINSRALGYGDPIRVAEGQRVLFRILNASATLTHRLALTGHKFNIVSLDGNKVPVPREVEILEMGPAERIDAVVTMNNPGVWILGEMDDHIRNSGLGIVVEYANRGEQPKWIAPANAKWDYLIFGNATAGNATAAGESEARLVPLVFRRKFAGNRWVDKWTINGKSYPHTDPLVVRANQKYRLRFDNQSNDAHPVHLHRHSFELTKFAGQPTSGLIKDVVVVPPQSQVEADFVADNPGPTLFHCHQQLHMDYGFMALVQYSDPLGGRLMAPESGAMAKRKLCGPVVTRGL